MIRALLWKIQLLLYLTLYCKECKALYTATEWPKNVIERYHVPREPSQLIGKYVNGTQLLSSKLATPDFRVEEDAWLPFRGDYYKEYNRPYRFSPYWKQLKRWDHGKYRDPKFEMEVAANDVGCYCTTVYKRLTVLAGCATITENHLLTTATSVELVLQHHRNTKSLENILGAWYDHNQDDTYNSSMYMTPSRIHYHPLYLPPHKVNISHPLPARYDLCIWAATIPFYKGRSVYTVICSRGGPHWKQWKNSTPTNHYDTYLVVGFQYVKAQRKRPVPWIRYVTRTSDFTAPCPKTEWQWFHCVKASYWSKYGVESGAALHRSSGTRFWIFDGLVGMCAFSMKLRSMEMNHYFTVVNTHPVLEFLYDAYMGRLPYEYLDHRFEDTMYGVPKVKRGHYVDRGYRMGANYYYAYGYSKMPWY